MGGNTQSRRGFLQGAAAVTITASVGGLTACSLRGDGGVRSSRTLTADELDRELFEPIVGDEVTLAGSAGLVSSVTDRVSYSNADGESGTSFSVIIESFDAFEQGTYDVRHRGVGTMPLFVVPVDAPNGETFTYEAVFNRLD